MPIEHSQSKGSHEALGLGLFPKGKRTFSSILTNEIAEQVELVNANMPTNRGQILIWTNAIANAYAIVQCVPKWIDWTKGFRVRYFVNRLLSSINGTIRFGAEYVYDDWGSDTVSHVGFRIADTTVYASNGNGTINTSTDITAQVSLANGNSGKADVWEIEFVPGQYAKFYFNGTLVATHTTNLPSSSGGYAGDLLHIFIDNSSSAVSQRFYCLAISAEVDI